MSVKRSLRLGFGSFFKTLIKACVIDEPWGSSHDRWLSFDEDKEIFRIKKKTKWAKKKIVFYITFLKKTPTTSARGSPPSSKGQFPVQYIDSGEPQRSMGDILLPYQDSVSIFSVVMERDIFDFVLIGCMCGWSKAWVVPGCDETGDERTWSIDVRFHVTLLRERRLAWLTFRIDTSIPKINKE